MLKAAEVLSRLLEADPEAISRLILTRVECEKPLADALPMFVRETISEQTVNEHGEPVPVYDIGVIGLLNAILKEAGVNMVATAYVEGRRELKGFREVLGVDEQTGEVSLSQFKPHEQRVLVEKRELDEKIQKLEAFLKKPDIQDLVNAGEIEKLTEQLGAMFHYTEVLQDRIDAFAQATE